MHDSFFARLAGHGATDAVILGADTVGYSRLLSLVDGWQRRLDAEDVRPGTVVALEATYSPNSCAALLALVRRAAIVVPMTGVPSARKAEFHDIAETEVTVSIEADGRDWRLARSGRVATHEYYTRLRDRGAPGLVLFSSGTTGRSKASVLDFDRLLARYDGPPKPRRVLSFLNLDHIGGVNTLLHTFANGGTVITTAGRTPDAVFAAIAEHRVEVLPTTPTFLNMVLISGAYERHDAGSLRLITYGTEPMPTRTLRRLRDALPTVRLKQTYGLSELGILPTRSRDDGSVWMRLGGAGFDYKIVDDVLWIRSDMAMLGYLNAPAPFDADGYFNTEDLVETDGDHLRILGRKSEIINVGGEKVYPTEVETVLLDAPNIAEATVSGLPNPVTGMVVKATVRVLTPEDATALRRRVQEHCRDRLEAFKVPMVVEISDRRLHSDRMKKIRTAS